MRGKKTHSEMMRICIGNSFVLRWLGVNGVQRRFFFLLWGIVLYDPRSRLFS